MGLFGLFGKKKKSHKAGKPKVSVQVMVRGADGRMVDADSPEFRRQQEEEKRRRLEEERERTARQESNRRFLAENGVDVDGFLPEMVVVDALMVVERVCPPMSRFDHGLRGEEPRITFSSPTRTGKVPKNVVEAYVSHEVVREVPSGVPGITRPEFGDRLSVSLSYIAPGVINKADLVGSHGGTLVSVSVRSRDGELMITGGQVTRLSDGSVQSLYPGEVPSDHDEAVAGLASEVEKAYRRK